MTTIAWDGKSLAADSRATEADGSARTDRFVKLYRVQCKVDPIRGEVLMAAAGCEFAGELFRQWLERGGNPDLVERGVRDDDEVGSPIDVLLVHASGAYTANHLCCFIKVRDQRWAHGTGRQGALCLMARGDDAAAAVRGVRKFDNATGGRVVSMTLKGPKRARKKGTT
jgi:hypothetical protein